MDQSCAAAGEGERPARLNIHAIEIKVEAIIGESAAARSPVLFPTILAFLPGPRGRRSHDPPRNRSVNYL